MTGRPPRHWETADEEATRALGRRLAEELAPDGVLLLDGDLGAGKTVLARGVGEALGIDPREIQSPTFILVREHEGRGSQGAGGRLVHMDLYRLEPEETDAVGLDELLAGPGVKVIEWADRLPWRPPGALHLRLERRPEGGRRIVEL